MNPYLPEYEYVPDGEPHVFGDRVYIFGSHDRFNSKKFCMNDYVAYSAKITDLSNWRYEGVIYPRNQDPRVIGEDRQLWAPDVVCGKDGRYYLYYCLDGDGQNIGVAVCDTRRAHTLFTASYTTKMGVILEVGLMTSILSIRLYLLMMTERSTFISETAF